MKKKFTACMAAACLAATAVGSAVALTGCGGGGSKFPTTDSDPNANISILLLANSAETAFYKTYFKEKEQAYNEKNGTNITIKFEGLEEGPYKNRRKTDIQQGATPDIFYVRPNEILQFKDNIYCLQEFVDSYNFFNNDIELDKIYDLALDLYKYNDKTNKMDAENGELYAFPKDLSVQQLGYNKTIVAAYATEIKGAGLKLPWEMDFTTENYTWGEYREMCEIIAQAAATKGNKHYASDIPDIEILAKCYGGSILDTENLKVTITSDAVTNAIALQKDLLTPSGDHGNYAAADKEATQEQFEKGNVAFYGAVASWEVGGYDGAGAELGWEWDVMPWPTLNGDTNWYGKITSAGYVVSNKCKNWQFAMELAASFMSTGTQEKMVQDAKICIPLNSDMRGEYVDPANDGKYSPKSRSVFVDVISGTHGFRPAKYYTYEETWLLPLTTQLEHMQKHESYTINGNLQAQMQEELDLYKAMY